MIKKAIVYSSSVQLQQQSFLFLLNVIALTISDQKSWFWVSSNLFLSWINWPPNTRCCPKHSKKSKSSINQSLTQDCLKHPRKRTQSRFFIYLFFMFLFFWFCFLEFILFFFFYQLRPMHSREESSNSNQEF